MRHVLIVVAGGLVLGCGATRSPSHVVRRRVATPPAAEFLLGAGDSTFWVKTGRDGIHVRGAPLTLARYGGRFYEIYVADDDRSYTNAVFVGQRIYRRDLIQGDSVAVFEDTAVGRAAARYAARHPDDSPLEPDEDAADDPTSSVTGEIDVLELHGPFLSYQYHGALKGEAGTGETIRRGVLDLRSTGAPKSAASLRVVLGVPAADRIIAAGQRRFGAVKDSVRAIGVSDDESVRRGARALSGGAFAFDPGSFTLADHDRTLEVSFIVPGHGVIGNGRYLSLGAIAATGMLPAWWREVRPTLPEPESTAVVWRHGKIDIVARYDTIADDVQLALRDSTRHEWPVAHVPSPARRVFWLDVTPDAATRKALVRAFDESALYSDDARSVRYKGRLPRATARLTSNRSPMRTKQRVTRNRFGH
ncbi:MAG TPA: hypothetical protein VFA43_15860 [Gemmatimonadaceae bacterium]|nr:hypothetical protein [Gemmatimonadaceae bacterium]